MTGICSIVVLGGPGDGLVVAEALRWATAAGEPVKLAGFLNDALPVGTMLQDAPVLGNFESWPTLPNDLYFVPAIQKVQDMPARVARLDSLGIPDNRWATVIHPRATVASSVDVGKGAFIASGVTIQPDCKIGAFASLRSGAVLGHHASIEEHAYVGPNATMCGRTLLEKGAHLGPGAILLDYKRMGRFSVAGIGAAVTKDVPEYWVVFGNPAKRVGFVRRLKSQLNPEV